MVGAVLVSPKRFCATQGCPNRVSHGHCQDHQRKKEQARGTRTERRYDNRWLRYSQHRLMREPICAEFPKGIHDGVPTPATCTDHILSAKARPDLFWEPTNHQSLCADCNKRKAIAEEGAFGH